VSPIPHKKADQATLIFLPPDMTFHLDFFFSFFIQLFHVCFSLNFCLKKCSTIQILPVCKRLIFHVHFLIFHRISCGAQVPQGALVRTFSFSFHSPHIVEVNTESFLQPGLKARLCYFWSAASHSISILSTRDYLFFTGLLFFLPAHLTHFLFLSLQDQNLLASSHEPPIFPLKMLFQSLLCFLRSFPQKNSVPLVKSSSPLKSFLFRNLSCTIWIPNGAFVLHSMVDPFPSLSTP